MNVSGYVTDFTVYTLAMMGVIFIAFVAAKKALSFGENTNKGDKFLSVESSLNIAPRKTIHVVKAGNEKFLIASDTERTAFLTKLGAAGLKQDSILEAQPGANINLDSLSSKSNQKNDKKSVMRSMLAKLGE